MAKGGTPARDQGDATFREWVLHTAKVLRLISLSATGPTVVGSKKQAADLSVAGIWTPPICNVEIDTIFHCDYADGNSA
ncbi:MAG: hypothetical protein NTAFB09_19200 [Nitrosospira sp.]